MEAPPKIPNLVVDLITNPPATPYYKGLLSDEEVAPVLLGWILNRLLDDARRADSALRSAPDQQFLYYHFKSDHQIWLKTVFDKDGASDLNPKEKKALRTVIEGELTARAARRRRPRRSRRIR